MIKKATLKHILGELPFAAELYWQVRQGGKPLSKSFSLRRVQNMLPEWLEQAGAAREFRRRSLSGAQPALDSRKILIFATLRYWIEHAVLTGLALAGQGHDVTLAYLPYNNWRKPFNRFDLRRQNIYARTALAAAAPLLKSVSLLDVKPAPGPLPHALAAAVQAVALRDTQYTLQIEDVDLQSELYRLRLERNRQAAVAALALLQSQRPDVLVTPNGSILEMGAVYQVARHLDIPVVTYEFGEQRGRIWLAHNAEVMRQETDAMWQTRQDIPLDESQWEQVRALFSSRQKASLWENFARRWQGQPSQGGEQVRRALGLDSRPVVLLAANVIGDSLTLGRQVFSESMTAWLERTVLHFAQRPEVQLVVRIHPGERYTQGPSVADVVQRALLDLPDHIRVVAANAPVNTYDLVEIADLGLVYTTTVGMEMAMSGVPVIVAGQTHYRGKGFTIDPATWENYFTALQTTLPLAQDVENAPGVRLSRQQVERAWTYAYRFFFDYPCPFPWRLLDFWDQLKECSLAQALSPEGQDRFGAAFRYLAGEPRQWDL